MTKKSFTLPRKKVANDTRNVYRSEIPSERLNEQLLNLIFFASFLAQTRLTTSTPKMPFRWSESRSMQISSRQDSRSWKVFYKRMRRRCKGTNKSDRGNNGENEGKVPRTFQMEKPLTRDSRRKFSHNEVSSLAWYVMHVCDSPDFTTI